MSRYPGAEATARLGWWRAHRFLLLRRLCQFGVLGLFLLGPLAGIWILKGNLSSSLLLETVPLTDPLTLLQSVAAGQWPIPTLWLGAGLVLAGYWLVGGRVFCSWVCPVNLVTDAAAWLRGRLGLKGNGQFNRATRYWLLAMVLVAPAIAGVLVWELVNPVPLTLRGLLFGMGAGWALLAVLFLFDLFVVERGWCGHLCPVGAFYALVNRVGFIKIAASGRERCSNCMDCYAVCPERPILRGPVHGARRGHGPLIAAQECTNCGRCIDVCAEQVFEITVGFAVKAEKTSENT
ncbi:quinol dehydrogenase ferredoxin subunit NapH [Aeromonas caviae]|uniref:quinol dehydrogenase ferredoxin subunit NapH n=1 Tax=Aeromonas caviae TaxID=648 RepID=UPI0022537471|nr:quinol dehydrogenase ferredoxin subunit NapH [Aeromonas caviae]MCX4031079.1 quinol dehydrogenase ferredoxin subunit NapH [Aeromonas caviae]